MILGSKIALQKAKDNIEKSFPVVGILEDLPITMKLLEKIMPQYFSNILKVYEEELGGNEFLTLINAL